MTVFGIGTLELVLILLLLILIFGPDRIVEVGTWLGQSYRKLTGVTSEINQQVMQVRKAMDANAGLAEVTNPLKETVKDINAVQKGLERDLQTSADAIHTKNASGEAGGSQLEEDRKPDQDSPKSRAEAKPEGQEQNAPAEHEAQDLKRTDA